MSDIFYKKGLRFECTHCSRCCRLTPGYVFLTFKDLKDLMKATGLFQKSFLETYCREVNISGIKRISLKEKNNLDCIFWENGGCAVYEYRPFQCKSYPFWSSNLSSPGAWEELKKSCPGVGRGRLHSKTMIDYWLKSRQKKEQFLEASSLEIREVQ